METALSDPSDWIVALEDICSGLKSDNTQLKAQVEDLELHSRCNNLHLVGILEKMEGTDPVPFIASSLLCPQFSTKHTTGQAKFRYYHEKERVLRREEIRHNIFIFPDMMCLICEHCLSREAGQVLSPVSRPPVCGPRREEEGFQLPGGNPEILQP